MHQKHTPRPIMTWWVDPVSHDWLCFRATYLPDLVAALTRSCHERRPLARC